MAISVSDPVYREGRLQFQSAYREGRLQFQSCVASQSGGAYVGEPYVGEVYVGDKSTSNVDTRCYRKRFVFATVTEQDLT